MALPIKSSFESFGNGGGQDRIHDLSLRDSFISNITLIAATSLNIVRGGRKMNEQWHHFETTFIFFRLTELGDIGSAKNSRNNTYRGHNN